ncbi:pyridoxal phosphate-dependent aminotransferase [Clostridium sp. CM028]|uniref:pyridoxal phosphate-dependent aminotransferase n=1 Tax=unclassified Clostridium TaxID=2614128 RepID=UPI001C0C6FED|nr:MULTISPECIES: pyridoxal phosphate-dependent aminotransferase [unclassified Clostridium]MBU3092240.1 pyridoxal phosphate-dependent aminotransferase [Clostridium sp. CF011]MBW9144057.1 pyridoxal phosphate-dependent aminotransferase [Clostridium sp. CM027]MBW9147632.1 pyridoxal phosphate-dependent aminotransferase [Clostridium sp. CM028]UVE41292.1 pyridoxal phosphate-dependent aminotransferase [Clostridium sp. CM027]WAG70289.1 pyridoxal phosphate-dependent aminotransferase [Clostridium sp. CF0
MVLSKKAKQITTSLTLDITAKAKKMKAEGIDVIGFGAGEPDFDTPKNIQEAAIKAIKEGRTRYTAASGIIELKQAIIGKLKRENNLTYTPAQIIVSAGAKQCLANVFQAILNPGDEVLIGVPYWVSYPELVKLADGEPIYIETEEINEFKLTIASLNRALTPKSKAIILNSPNNPTGTVYSKEELMEIADFAKINNLIIISDEIYEKLLYGSNDHISIASLSEDAYRRTIVINGLSKAYAMTGWRIGYAAGSTEIVSLMSNIQSHTTSNPNSIAQYASVEALNGNQDDIAKMIGQFKLRRDYMVEKINSINNLSCIKPEGAFYVMVNIGDVLNKSIDGKVIKDSIAFSDILLEKEKVAVIPGIAFGVDNFIRLSYATSMENIKIGLDRIARFVENI